MPQHSVTVRVRAFLFSNLGFVHWFWAIRIILGAITAKMSHFAAAKALDWLSRPCFPLHAQQRQVRWIARWCTLWISKLPTSLHLLMDKSLLNKVQSDIINADLESRPQSGVTCWQATQQRHYLVLLRNRSSNYRILHVLQMNFHCEAPSFISVRKYCFFRNSLFANVLRSKWLRKASQASFGRLQEVTR